MSGSFDVIVVGAGSAGFSAAAAAREYNNTSSILLINGEELPPYDRTVLSKSISDTVSPSIVPLQGDEWFSDHRITRMDNAQATRVDPDGHYLVVNGEQTGYGSLVLATGAEPIFPKLVRHHERGSFFVIRNAADAAELGRAAKRAKTVLVAGMGVLAVEIAFQLAVSGKKITLAGATPQLMPRQLSARGSELLEEAIARRGVKLLFQEEIISFEQNKEHSWTVEMLKHSSHYDMVVFCIGVQPAVSLARDAGIAVQDGILVDPGMATEDPHIFAAGDCAQLPDGRVSHLWQEAAAQGRIAGINAAGGNETLPDRRYPLRSQVFGIELYSSGVPRRPWEFDVDEYESGNSYYALYWSPEDYIRGAIVMNDLSRAERLDVALRERWPRQRVEDALGSPDS